MTTSFMRDEALIRGTAQEPTKRSLKCEEMFIRLGGCEVLKMEHYDAIIIGTGQAGPSLAARLAGAGMNVAIIERKLFGGTCVNTGCDPTKAMIASAYAAHLARRAAEYGIRIDGAINMDMKAVKARKDAVSEQSRTGIATWLKGMKNCTVYQNHARFESPKDIRAGSELLNSDRIFIDVGGRAVIPSLPGVNEIPYLTNSSMMEVDFLPRHLVIVGGGYVGLEFGQMFRRFGSEVTILEMGPRLIGHEDEDISRAVEEILRQEGINVRLNSRCIGFRPHESGATVTVECDEGAPEVIGSHVLLATGRRPNTDDLGIEKAGIVTDKRGYIVVDDELRTNIPGIWAVGDCNGRGAFTHTAYNDYEIVAANLLDGESRRISDRITAYNIYTDPPLGRAGLTEAEARNSTRHVLMGQLPMTKVGRAVEKGETKGFMKILVDGDNKQVLGAAILGTGGDEVIHCVLDMMYAKAEYTVMQRAVHIHPTVAELLPTMLGDLRPLPTLATSATRASR
jgi:pyruvate/2-oxoglutarate dehydrogenase complex dihydrolipoamide dehydrogenase (E3) component